MTLTLEQKAAAYDKMVAYNKAYQQTPKWKAYKKAYQQTPKGKAYKKAYYLKNRDRMLEKMKAYYLKHKKSV